MQFTTSNFQWKPLYFWVASEDPQARAHRCRLRSHLRGPGVFSGPAAHAALKAVPGKPTATSTRLPSTSAGPRPHGNTNLALPSGAADPPAGQPAPSEPGRRGPQGPAPSEPAGVPRDPAPPPRWRARRRCPGARAPRRSPGRAAGRSCGPGRRDPGESCRGNLSGSGAPVPASCIIHGRRRGAGPSACTGRGRPASPAGAHCGQSRALGGDSA